MNNAFIIWRYSCNQSINIRLLTRKCQNALSDIKWVKINVNIAYNNKIEIQI